MTPRVILVTGGAKGIGAALAAAHREAGDVVVAADLDPEEPRQVRLDVTDRDDFARVARQVVQDHGRIDVFYNNAGIAVAGLVEELTAEHWDRALAVNLHGVVHGIEAVYPLMRARGAGHIVNTASLAGQLQVPVMAPYTATKHAVVALSQVLRMEAKAHGIRVTAICPAFVDTPLLDHINPGSPPTKANRVGVGMVRQLQGRPMRPEAVAATIVSRLDRNPAIITVPRIAALAVLADRFAPAVARLVAELEVRRYRRLS